MGMIIVSTTPRSGSKANSVSPDPNTNNNNNNNYGGWDGGSGGGGGGGDDDYSPPPAKDWGAEIKSNEDASKNLFDPEEASKVNAELMKASGLEEGPAEIDRIQHIDTEAEEALLKQITDTQKQQAELQTNNTVRTGTEQLQRAMQDAQEQYQTQRDQIAQDEHRALDNQVLYAESRGDRGGIGQQQYNTIMNTAATNRLTVQKEQTKLATDTARQISDLRAQGEFEKANQLLSITQNYLSQLMNLYTWAKETNLGVDEFNSQISQWEENYKLSLLGANLDIANATGAFSNGTPTFTAQQRLLELLANSGNALMQAGVAPTTEQLAAMGLSKDQAVAYLKKYFPNG